MKKAKTVSKKWVLSKKGPQPKSIPVCLRITPATARRLKLLCSKYKVTNERGEIVRAPKTVVVEHIVEQTYKYICA